MQKNPLQLVASLSIPTGVMVEFNNNVYCVDFRPYSKGIYDSTAQATIYPLQFFQNEVKIGNSFQVNGEPIFISEKGIIFIKNRHNLHCLSLETGKEQIVWEWEKQTLSDTSFLKFCDSNQTNLRISRFSDAQGDASDYQWVDFVELNLKDLSAQLQRWEHVLPENPINKSSQSLTSSRGYRWTSGESLFFDCSDVHQTVTLQRSQGSKIIYKNSLNLPAPFTVYSFECGAAGLAFATFNNESLKMDSLLYFKRQWDWECFEYSPAAIQCLHAGHIGDIKIVVLNDEVIFSYPGKVLIFRPSRF